MINCDLLKLSFVWNFHNKKMCTVQPSFFWYWKISLYNKNCGNIQFFSSNKQFKYYLIRFFVTSYISSQTTEYSQQKIVVLQNDVFSVAVFCLPRRLQDVLQDAFKTSSGCLCVSCLEDVFKTYLEVVLRAYLEDFFKLS